MKIAHIAPPWLPIPPETYGGTENVLFDLVETQVELGHEVILFAPGDATTSARLISVIPGSLKVGSSTEIMDEKNEGQDERLVRHPSPAKSGQVQFCLSQ